MPAVEPREAHLVELSTGSAKKLSRPGLGTRYQRTLILANRQAGEPIDGAVESLVEQGKRR